MGVLAGEMRNDWPMEALKAQAVLARTFVLKFISEKNSRYDGADISTDITVLETMMAREGLTGQPLQAETMPADDTDIKLEL